MFATFENNFGHEIAHVLGAEHEPGQFNLLRPEQYPFAHRVAGVARDVLALKDASPWKNQFSNPDKLFSATAVASGTIAPLPGDGTKTRNGSRIIRNYSLAVSDYYPDVGNPPSANSIFWDDFE